MIINTAEFEMHAECSACRVAPSSRALQWLLHHRYLIGSSIEPPLFSQSGRKPFPYDMEAAGPHQHDQQQSNRDVFKAFLKENE